MYIKCINLVLTQLNLDQRFTCKNLIGFQNVSATNFLTKNYEWAIVMYMYVQLRMIFHLVEYGIALVVRDKFAGERLLI